MSDIKLILKDKKGKILKERNGKNETFIDYHHPYALGDYYEMKSDKEAFVIVELDAALSPALLYVPEGNYIFEIPFDIQRESPYPEGAFLSSRHYAKVRYAQKSEITRYRNLAENSHDQHEMKKIAFPHALANAETRGETVFFARNAIDGIVANESHGNYPYQSWGINQQDDAEITIDFGRKVTIDKIGIVLRADYPHDSYWTEITVQFSDSSSEIINLKKTADKQLFLIKERKTTWVKLTNLVKDTDMSTFPALTQLEVYGK